MVKEVGNEVDFWCGPGMITTYQTLDWRRRIMNLPDIWKSKRFTRQSEKIRAFTGINFLAADLTVDGGCRFAYVPARMELTVRYPEDIHHRPRAGAGAAGALEFRANMASLRS